MTKFHNTKYEPQVSRSHYESEGFSPLRTESVTEQLREVCYSGCTKILEIGVGRGLLKHFLQPFPDISHVSIDVDECLHPDYVGSVLQMPFKNKQFELAVCCQVLEHLPFEQFVPALREIRRVTEKKVILSLPDIRKHLGIAVRVPGIKDWIKWELNLDSSNPGCKKFNGQHYWEIGYKGTMGRTIINKIREAGFRIRRKYRLRRHRWHTFFILQPESLA
jgi:SAM-dependent methyltransferase